MAKFNIIKQSKKGRIGIIECSHGIVETPAIFFCATKASIKGLTSHDVNQLGTQAIICNTYNLMDYPGGEFIHQSGGLHKMMDWHHPIWTDSGGFQIFSLGHGVVSDEIKGKRHSTGFKVQITEESAIFQSPRDGVMRELSPEKSIQIQKQLGSDFLFVLDECTPYHLNKGDVSISMARSHRWAERSLSEYNKICNKNQSLYGIVQGGVHKDLRLESIAFANSLPFFGYGIGGSLGKLRDDMMQVLSVCNEYLDPTKPKHLLGIGTMNAIEHAVKHNIDTFDCVHPTRIARHGGALVSKANWTVRPDGSYKEHISILNSIFKHDYTPIDSTCDCYTCRRYTKSYLHYLLKAKELTGTILLVKHNMYFMNEFMKNIRANIKNS